MIEEIPIVIAFAGASSILLKNLASDFLVEVVRSTTCFSDWKDTAGLIKSDRSILANLKSRSINSFMSFKLDSHKQHIPCISSKVPRETNVLLFCI